MISEGKFIYDYITTEKPRYYEIQYEEQDWTLIDLGGSARCSMHWRNFLEGAHGIVFIIDMTDESKFPQAKYEIESLINNNYPARSSMMILFNKVDLAKEDTKTADKLLITMNLSNRTLLENSIICQVVSLQRGDNFEQSVRSLFEQMNDGMNRKQRSG